MKNLEERIDGISAHYIELGKNIRRMLDINLTILDQGKFDKTLYGEAKLVEDKINVYELLIKEDTIGTLARFQPTAGDLRNLISYLEGARTFERMGDLLLDNVSLIKKLDKLGTEYKKYIYHVESIAKKVMEIYNLYMEALVEKDEKKAYTLLVADEEINDVRARIVESLVETMKESPDNVDFCNLLLLTVKKYERLADKVVQLGKILIYNVNGANVRRDELTGALLKG